MNNTKKRATGLRQKLRIWSRCTGRRSYICYHKTSAELQLCFQIGVKKNKLNFEQIFSHLLAQKKKNTGECNIPFRSKAVITVSHSLLSICPSEFLSIPTKLVCVMALKLPKFCLRKNKKWGKSYNCSITKRKRLQQIIQNSF